MEYAGGGDILHKIKDQKIKGDYFPEQLVWKYFCQLLKGLNSLHSLGILHRDIKCANIFIKEDQESVKLGDLNVSKVQKKKLART